MGGFFKIIGGILAVWLIWMGIILFSGQFFVDQVEQTYNKAIEEQKQALELVGDVTMSSSGSYGYYTYNIEGILKNVSGKKLNYAQVSFVIYDTAGNNVGSAFDNINYIDVNGTWKFSATYFGKEPKIKYSPAPEITSW